MDISSRLEDLYKNKYALFFNIGRTHGLSHDAIFDALQSTFIKALQNKKRFESMSDSEMRSYIIRIMRNECINYYRIESRYINQCSYDSCENNSDSVLENVPDTSISSLDHVILTEEINIRNEAILKIPEKYREIVRLSLDGYKRKEVAQLLKIKETNIQNLKHRGLKQYYAILGKMGS